MIVRTLLYRALRTIGALASGETPRAEEAQDALAILQAMLSAWRIDRLTIPVISREVFAVTATTASYTLGPDGAWDRALAPMAIDKAAWLNGDTEDPIEVLTAQRWQRIPTKSETGTPSALYLSLTAPLPTVTLWPVPDASGSVVLYLPTPLTQPIDLDTDLVTTDGYDEAYLYSLCVRLALEFGKPLDPLIRQLAIDSKARIEAIHVAPAELTIDPALRACYSHALEDC